MKNLLILFFCLTTLSCQEYEYPNLEAETSGICGITNPLKELPWLKAMVDQYYEEPESQHCQLWRVERGVYQGKTVFIPTFNGVLCCLCIGNSVIDCEGKTLFVCDPDKEKQVKSRTLIWER